jgi:hypothetical protein
MAITINQAGQPDRFASLHWIQYQLQAGQTPDDGGRWLLTMSGIALVDFRGGSDGFRRDNVILELDLTAPASLWPPPPPPPPPPTPIEQYRWGAGMEQWAPIASMNSFGASDTTGAGYAVDTVESGYVGEVSIGVGVRDSRAVVWRVAYHATWIFTLAAEPVFG